MSDKEKRPEGRQPNAAIKWKTPEDRRAACEAFCEHLRAGFSWASFPDADEDTVKRYIRDFPEDFCPEKVQQAERQSRHFWEKIGIAGTTGKLKGFNAKSWEFNMQNRLGWSTKADVNNHNTGSPQSIVYIELDEKQKLENHINDIVEDGRD